MPPSSLRPRPRSPIRRCAIWAPSAEASPTQTPPPTCPPSCSRSAPSWSPVRTAGSGASTAGRSQPTDFFVDLLTTALEPNEILTEIRIPGHAAGSGAAYAKMANKASHFAIVGVAVSVTLDGGFCTSARVGVTGAGSSASRATASESALRGSSLDDATITRAASAAASGIDFNEDVHASAEYREHLTKVFAMRAIRAAAERAAG